MATRIRTQQFFKSRNEYRLSGHRPTHAADGRPRPYNHASTTGLLNNGANEIEMTSQVTLNMPPEWLGHVSDIQYELQKIRSKMNDLSELHRKHLLPGFELDRNDQEHAIEILTGQITKMFRESQSRIKNVGQDSRLTAEEKQMRQNIQSNTASQLQDLSVLFRKNQKSYLQGLRNMQRKGKGAGKGSFIDLDETELARVEERGFSQEQLQQVDRMRADITQRETDIIQIAKSIHELAEIFKDLSLLVIDQGTILDRIDYNIEQTDQFTSDAIVELTQANTHQKAMRTKLCMLLLLVLIFCMVIVVLMKRFI
eukprot:TRINITY_DN1000_c0_g1_i1.p1 TRINITY_DN1000_c0_g1~~TRINITY_DN1000_c0_g1_i1.p1  ORF type:complete len:333 (-),score=73.01 TRINITY_DN1000_c0_g1_i1:27-962(-)